MLTDSAQVSIPATSTVNVVAGHPIEFIGVPSITRLLAVADAIGVQMQFLINVGGDQKVPIAATTSVNTAAGAGQGPKDDEDTMANRVPLPAGSRNQWNFTNTTAAAINIRWRAFIEP